MPVVANKIDKWVWICISSIFLEGVILIAFKNFCPITIIARKFSNSQKDNFDIYLPNWLAKYNKQIYSIIVLNHNCDFNLKIKCVKRVSSIKEKYRNTNTALI